MPSISIITINYNNASGLEKTILSVVEQLFQDYSFIIIDGGSNDGSIDIIKKYADKITYWVSEKDDGIYNAMNKGTKQANGEYYYYLNSGDIFFNNKVLLNVSPFLNSQNELVAGDVELSLQNGDKNNWKTKNLYRVSEVAFGHIPHQGFFFKKILFEIYGLYNERLKIVSDWEYFLRIVIGNVSIKYTGITFAIHFADGISNDLRYLKQQERERKVVLRNLSTLYDDLNELFLTRNVCKYFQYRLRSFLKRSLKKINK